MIDTSTDSYLGLLSKADLWFTTIQVNCRLRCNLHLNIHPRLAEGPRLERDVAELRYIWVSVKNGFKSPFKQLPVKGCFSCPGGDLDQTEIKHITAWFNVSISLFSLGKNRVEDDRLYVWLLLYYHYFCLVSFKVSLWSLIADSDL